MSKKRLEKEKADVNMYYNLLTRKIDKFKAGENVFLIHLGNSDVIYRFIVNNMNCNYFIIDQSYNGDLLKLFFPQIKFIGTEEDESIIDAMEKLNMKFDKIIMNPPYSKNLHLKILAKAIEQLTEDGECVNLSPIRWLQDPLAKYKKNSDYKKFEKSIRQHIYNIEVIDKLKAQKIFNDIVIGTNLGIYSCVKKTQEFNFDSLINPIVKKYLAKNNSIPNFDINMKDGWRVRIPIISNNGGSGTNRKDSLAGFGKVLYFFNGKSKDGKLWYENYGTNQYSKKYIDLIPNSIHFNTEIEAKNFCKSYNYQEMKTFFPAYITSKLKCDVHVTPNVICWMGDCINPRTGLKGYESEWTNEDFYTYFNITKEEQELIEKTMEKYM